MSNTRAHSLPEIVDCVTSLACLVEGVVLLFLASPTIVSYVVNHMFLPDFGIAFKRRISHGFYRNYPSQSVAIDND